MNCPRCQALIPADGPAGMCPKCLLSVGLGEPEVVLTDAGDPAPPPPTPAELQPFFPHLEILRLVGRGGMGAVYEARQKGLGRSVALKILSAPTRADSSFEERFVREAQALARLSHENIVAVYDAGRAGPHFFLTMEYVDGPNLRQAERAGHIEPAQALALVVQICAALDYAHKNGIVHRDIKPENVLLARDGKVKIVDFGLAKVLDRAARGLSLTRLSQTMGTPHYMAPEQIERPKDVDHRADIYSLGVVFYELLTGELPLGRFPLPSEKVQIDVRLDDIVIRTLAKEPERRYQAAGEVRTAVQDVAGSPMQATRTAPSEAVVPARTWSPGLRVAVVLLALLVLVGLAVVGLLLVRPGLDVHLAQDPAAPPDPQLVHAGDPAIAARAQSPESLLKALATSDQSFESVQKALAKLNSAQGSGVVYAEVADSSDLEKRWKVLDSSLLRPDVLGALGVVERYAEQESARTEVLPPESEREVASVRIVPDVNLVARLRAELGGLIQDRLAPTPVTPETMKLLVEERMPYGSGPVTIRITREDFGWSVTTIQDSGTMTEQYPELPSRYQPLVERCRAAGGTGR
ncbi:MAG: serine/threonine-protein kinase [Planctomycetota bacterium]|nr:serine/threonine-protein kinase [Planctomycetota bacterium]